MIDDSKKPSAVVNLSIEVCEALANSLEAICLHQADIVRDLCFSTTQLQEAIKLAKLAKADEETPIEVPPNDPSAKYPY